MTDQPTSDTYQTELVNLRDRDDWSDIVRIDRTTMFGNPHRLEEDGGEYTRGSSVDAYALWFADRLEHGMPSGGPSAYEVEQAAEDLRGETLGCWCAPELCHGHVLLYYIDTGQTPRSVDELREWGAPERCSVESETDGGGRDV